MQVAARKRRGMKQFLKELTPPLAYKLLRRIVIRQEDSVQLDRGLERPSEWYDARYKEVESYGMHYADSPYYPLWCVLVDRFSRADVRCLFDVGCGPGQFGSFVRDWGLQ